MLESALDKMAQQILSLDEASLTSLWEKYRQKMEHFEPTREWEKAVVVFFIINAVRAKNHIFNEQLLRRKESRGAEPAAAKPAPAAPPQGKQPKGKPDLKLVKS
jgi:hypothetical protein